MIIIPSGKFLDTDDALITPNQLEGWFKIEALKVDAHGRPIERSRRVVADWFPNLITTVGLNRIGEFADSMNHCRVGSGNATPQFTDSQLQTQVAATSTVQTTAETPGGTPPNYFLGRTQTYRFAAGVAAGNLSEVGIGWTATGASLFSRALILDGSLNPTTITILSDEVLDVTYQSRYYPPVADQTYNITITGVGTVGVTARAGRVTSNTNYSLGIGGIWSPGGGNAVSAYNGAIGAVTGAPSGSGGSGSASSNAAYAANSLQRNFSFTFGLNNGNLAGGIRSLEVDLGQSSGNYGYMQYELNPVIPKLNTQVLTFNGTHSWTRR